MKLAILCLTLMVASCGFPIVTDDGCVLQRYQKGNQTYHAGPCIDDTTGQIDSVRVQWKNEEGIKIMLTANKDKTVLVEYLSPSGSGIWVEWSEKSGVMLGAVPDQAKAALDNSL